ncbi:DUF2514 family protein [Variovorax ginsengisoli]|uniref:DUF2514 family protein n=1 Tax=Variovorax ginsengisoli TaxID=363844 RepID=A0ABT8S1Y2_9BURK|nr:DUF2514 family protein [Variovorax ginsengisoli]MDN8612812.1 DUF2514 family protein [Variovorax ginsengisoli]MDO1531982.1 DUF2514 family protein [Variovorax ginsengisoli]
MSFLYTWAAGKVGWLAIIGALLAVVMFDQVSVSNARAGADRARTELASYRATQAEAGRLAERSRRETEQRWTRAVEGVANDGQKQIDVARADADRAGVAERRLQQRVSAFLAAIRGAAADSGIAATGPAAADPAVLLADLFGRARERARLLGEFADDAHARGRTCERYADELQSAGGH